MFGFVTRKQVDEMETLLTVALTDVRNSKTAIDEMKQSNDNLLEAHRLLGNENIMLQARLNEAYLKLDTKECELENLRPLKKPGPYRPKMSEEKIATIKRHKRDGMKHREIAKAVGCSVSVVSKYTKDT